MIHQHNASTLLGSKRKSVYYPPDGSGRDSYIRTDNGGTNTIHKHQGVPQLGNYMKFGVTTKTFKPASYVRNQKYISDGSGRDNYVVSRHGGQYNQQDQNSALLVKYRNTMRDGGWKKPSKSFTSDFVRPSQLRSNSTMFRTQSTNNRRLSEPRKQSEKYLEKMEQFRKTFHNHH